MSEVKIVATLTPLTEHIDEIRRAAQAMLAPTHNEAGCLEYNLHESQAITDIHNLDLPGKVSLVFIERWQSLDALKQHIATPHHDQFLADLEGKLESLNVQRLTQI